VYPAGLKVGRGPDAGPDPETPSGRDPGLHRGRLRRGVYIGQAGGEHGGFFDFYSTAELPRLREG